ncbi:MAG: McrC family protein [Ktedonobacteraceae bacterium]
MSTPLLPISLKEWEYRTPDSPGSKLANVVLEHDAQTKQIVQKLSESGILTIVELRDGLSIRTSSYVGRITLGNMQITVQPKISGAPFIRLLRYAYDLRDLKFQALARYHSEQDAFQELLISQLLGEINELVARGLQRKYVRTEDNLASPHGKINIQRIANQGGTLQATLPCTYHPRLEDCLANQVLLQGLLLAARLTNDSTLRIQLYRLARSFQEDVSSIQLDHHVFKQLDRELNRLIAAYKSAITLIELLFAAKGIALDEESAHMQLPGLLFDMNLFFQALLSRFLKEHLQGYLVQDQNKIQKMMSYDPAHNPQGRRAPKPRPDYVVFQQAKVVAILDAKYRDLWEKSLPEHMLYQLAMYALSQPNGMEAAILYPTMHAEAQEARILIHDPVYQTNRASVVLRPVNLIELDKLISGHATMDTMRKQTAFAEWLAFGKINAIHAE